MWCSSSPRAGLVGTALLELALVAAAAAYALGFRGRAAPGLDGGGYVELTEVLFAVLWAWLLLGELPGLLQLVGGVILLAGVAAARCSGVRRCRPEPKEPSLNRRNRALNVQVTVQPVHNRSCNMTTVRGPGRRRCPRYGRSKALRADARTPGRSSADQASAGARRSSSLQPSCNS